METMQLPENAGAYPVGAKHGLCKTTSSNGSRMLLVILLKGPLLAGFQELLSCLLYNIWRLVAGKVILPVGLVELS